MIVHVTCSPTSNHNIEPVKFQLYLIPGSNVPVRKLKTETIAPNRISDCPSRTDPIIE